jgi:hypothetical protein
MTGESQIFSLKFLMTSTSGLRHLALLDDSNTICNSPEKALSSKFYIT